MLPQYALQMARHVGRRHDEGIALPPLAATAVMPHGCGSAPDTEFKRRGTSLAVLRSGSYHCWTAQQTNINSDEAAGNLVAGYFVSGVLGAMVASSATEEARKDPKNYAGRKAHDTCMEQQGHEKVE